METIEKRGEINRDAAWATGMTSERLALGLRQLVVAALATGMIAGATESIGSGVVRVVDRFSVAAATRLLPKRDCHGPMLPRENENPVVPSRDAPPCGEIPSHLAFAL